MKVYKVVDRPALLYGSETWGNHDARHDSSRSCRDALSKKCQRIHKTGQNKKRSHKKRTRDIWNTRHEIQTQTKLDQPSWKNGHHQTVETRPQLQASRKKRSWTPHETMAMRRCWNRSNDLTHGGRWWWWWLIILRNSKFAVKLFFIVLCHDYGNFKVVECQGIIHPLPPYTFSYLGEGTSQVISLNLKTNFIDLKVEMLCTSTAQPFCK